MTVSLLIRLVLLALAVTGCAGVPKLTATGRYLQLPGLASFRQPLAIQVQDGRPWSERQPTSPSGFVDSTADAGEAARVPILLAQDLSRVLRIKKMAAEVRIFLGTEPIPPDYVLLRVTLHSWFGQVPHSTATAKASELLLGNTAFYAEGRCHFDTDVIAGKNRATFGPQDARVRFQVPSDATVAREGRIASARAADEAIALLMRRLEAHLSRSAEATPSPR